MLDHRRAFARTIHTLRNRQPLQQIVGGGLGHFESGLAARPWLNLVLRLPRFAAAGRRVLVGNVTGGPQSWPQQSIKRKHTKAAEKKHDGECNNIGMFKRPNQNSVHADKESSEHQCPRGSPSPLIMFCHKVMDALEINAPLANEIEVTNSSFAGQPLNRLACGKQQRRLP
jgi:hypothetical protein